MSQSRTRLIRPAQLIGLLLAFLSVSSLMGVLGAGLFAPLTGSAAITVKAMPSVFNELPHEINVTDPAEESLMLDATGAVIARFYDKQRIVVPSANISDSMKNAIIAIEDKRFKEHRGVDPQGILRALVNNLGDSGTQGASTITQQFVRNSLQERGYLEGDAEQVAAATEQTTQRKLREIKYALAIEQKMSKDDILTGYLNIAPFGPITYGVEAAAQRYFSKHASDLTYIESALLAGLVQSPVEYDPLTYPEAAQERRNTVLEVMRDQEYITQEEYDAGIAVPVADMLKPTRTPEGCSGADSKLAYFCDYVVGQFLNDKAFGENEAEREHLLKTGGITIRTTLDPAKQDAAYSALTSTIPVDDESDLDDALVSLDPKTGNIVAMAQNTTYGVEAGQTMSNYGAKGKFQVGSTFKVFTLIQWLKEGHSVYDPVGSPNRHYHAHAFSCDGQPITTTPFDVNDLPGKDGVMNSIRATGLSVNQAFVNMASRVDFCQIFQTAYDFGIDENGKVPNAYPAAVIGTVTASPLQLANAFGAMANDGNLCKPQSMTTVVDRDETTLKEYQPDCHQVLATDVAHKVSTVLSRSTAQYYTNVRIADGRPYAAKSGTTDNNSNTWFAGYTPSLATAAWVGHANASTTPARNVVINGRYYSELFGQTFIGPNIWSPYMSAALSGTPIENLELANLGSPPPPVSRDSEKEKQDEDEAEEETDTDDR
ncbi:penicillin-binding protein [Schaalia sp. ZJ405]|uniref:transglycosylase domain-containing protein n=1 Tax=Schaalia sp. ZJ405 TaxID=2709403 RepID=UPI0013EE39BE|nr:transglycosylase domain-containing protein [Schaalia sp. ZJ405]QPK81403.1 penicillin-binding protein [Schaalia sp. ZJ405]